MCEQFSIMSLYSQYISFSFDKAANTFCRWTVYSTSKGTKTTAPFNHSVGPQGVSESWQMVCIWKEHVSAGYLGHTVLKEQETVLKEQETVQACLKQQWKASFIFRFQYFCISFIYCLFLCQNTGSLLLLCSVSVEQPCFLQT